MANQTQKDLDIRINAIVNGLDEIVNIKDQIIALASQVAGIVEPAASAQQAITEIGTSGVKASSDLETLALQSEHLQRAIDGITSSKSLDEIQDQAKGALASLKSLSGDGVESLDDVGGAAQGVTDETKKLQDEVNSLIGILEDIAQVNSLEELQQVSADALDTLDSLGATAGDTSAAIGGISDSSNDASSTLDAMSGSADDTGNSFQKTQKAVDDFADAMLQLSQGNKSLEEVKQLSNQAVNALETLSTEGVQGFQSVNENVQLSGESVNNFNGTITDLIDQFATLGEANSLEDISGYAEIASESLTITSGAVDDLVTQLSEVESAGLESLTEGADDATGSVEGTTEAVDDVTTSGEQADSQLTDLQRTTRDLADTLRSASQAANNASGSLSDIGGGAGDATDNTDQLTDSLGGAADAADAAGQAAQDAAADTENLGGAQDGASDSAGGLGGAIDSLRNFFGGAAEEGGLFLDGLRSITNVGPTVGGVLGAVGGVVTKLTDQFGALVAGIAGFIAIASLKEAADIAARVEVLGITMNNVGQNVGYTKDQLAGFEKEVKSMGITTQAARETITQMASAGLELGQVSEGSASQVAQLARASQDLAVRMGGSSSETLQQMITNIQQLDTEGLRYMGIVLDVTKAQEKYATQMGISTGAMTQAQKQQAVLNQVLEQAKVSTGLYEESMESVGKKIGSLSRYQETLAEEIGNKLLPAYGKLVDNTTDYLKDLIEITENTDKAGSASRNYADAMDGLSKLIMNGFKAAFEIFAEANQGLSILFATVGDLLGLFGELFDVFDAGEDSVLSIGKVIGGFATVVAGLFALIIDGVGVIVGSFGMLGGAMMTAVGTIIEGLGQVLDYLPFVSDSVTKVGTNLKTMGTEGYNASGQMVDGILRGEGALGKFNERLLETNTNIKDIKASKDFDDLEAQIVKLLEAQRKGTMTSYELGEASKAAADKVKELGDSGQLTEKQIAALGAKLQAVGNKELDSYNQALQLIGVTSQEIQERTDAAFGEIVGGLKTLAQNANTTSEVFFTAFNRSIDSATTVNDIFTMVEALQSYQDRLKKTGQLTDEEFRNIQESANNLKAKFIEVFEEGLDTSTTTMQFAHLREDVEKTGKGLVDLGVLTEQELTQKLKALDAQAEATGIRLENLATVKGLEKMGIEFEELTTRIDGAFDKLLLGLDEVIAESKLTADQLAEIFDKAISTADSVEELKELKDRIKETFESGKLDADGYASSLTDIKKRMAEILEQDLNSATTKQELEEVRQKYIELAAQGEITNTTLREGMEKIKEKMEGLKPTLLELTKQTTELGKASVNVAQSESDAFNKLLDIQKKRNDLDKARTELSKEDNELNRIKVEIAEKAVELAEAEYQVAATKAQLERDNYDILITQQQVLNAEKLASTQIENEQAQQRLKALQDELAAKQIVYEKTAQTLSVQEKQVIAIQNQKAALEAQSIALSNTAEKTKEVAQETEDTFKKSMQQSTDFLNSMSAYITNATQNYSKRLQELGVEAGMAAKYASDQYRNMWGEVGNALRGSVIAPVKTANEAIAEHIKYLEQAKKREEDRAKAAQETMDKYNEISSNAQKIAELGYDANASWQNFANEGLTSSASTMAKMKADARDTIKAAQDSALSFLKSIDSIRLEYLEATGQEEEALKMRYAQRKNELALEYEMLKVQITAAQITAKAAGVSTSVLDKALSDAKKGYDDAQKMLVELEKMEKKKLDDSKAAAEAEAKQKAAEQAAKAKEDAANTGLTESTINAFVNKFNDTLAQVLKADPNHDGLDSKGQPIEFKITIGDKTISATTTDSKEDLISTLEKLNARKS